MSGKSKRFAVYILFLVSVMHSGYAEVIGRLQTERFGMPLLCMQSNLYVAGGHSDRGIIGTIELLQADGRASVEPFEVTPRYFHFGAASDDKLYLLGGISPGASCGSGSCELFEEIDPQQRSIRFLATPPHAVERAGAVIYSNHLYVVGGSTRKGQRVNYVQIYDFDSDSWSRGADMPVAREGDVILYEDKILVPGGYNGISAIRDFQVYNILEDRWDKRADLPVKMSAHQGVVIGDQLYTFGDYEYLDRVAVCDLASDKWKLVEVDYKPARHQGAAVMNDAVLIAGGNISPGSPYLDAIQKFTVDELKNAPRKDWLPGQEIKPRTGMPSRRYVHAFELNDKKAPVFELKLLNGDTFDLAAQTGRVVVLDFWSTGCGPCRRALPHMAQLAEEMKDKPVTLIGVALDNKSARDRVETLLRENQVNYPVGLNGRSIALDYYVSGIPCVVLIDTNGIIQGRMVGFSSGTADALRQIIQQMLDGKSLVTDGAEERKVYPVEKAKSAHVVAPEERRRKDYCPDSRIFKEKWRKPVDPGLWFRTASFPGPFAWQIPQRWLTRRNRRTVAVYRAVTGEKFVSFPLERTDNYVASGDAIDGAYFLQNGDSGILVLRARIYEKAGHKPLGYQLLAINTQGRILWGKKALRMDYGIGTVRVLPVAENKDWLMMDSYDRTVILDQQGQTVLDEKRDAGAFGEKIFRLAADGMGTELLVAGEELVCYDLIPDMK